MDKNKIILIALIVVIIALLIGVFALMTNTNKQNTNLTFISNSTLNEGDYLEFKLTDANGNLLVNQTINVTITDSNKTSAYYSVVTNESGFGVLKLDKSAGKYNITINYGGNDIYKESNATQKITINEVVQEQTYSQTSSTSSGTSSSRYETDEYGVYDTYTGKYTGDGQVGGATREQVENYHPEL